jgi:dihydrolipoamide dehydrogenase
MKKIKFDICVVGGGGAGFASAMRSYDFGNHVCIIEGDKLGGAGIYGALTSKTMWELSKNYSIVKRIDRGYRASNISLDYNKVKDVTLSAAKEREYQLLSQIETLSRKAKSKKSITLIKGWGEFTSDKSLLVKKSDGSIIEIIANNFILATGSVPREHPLLKIDGKRIINSDHILKMEKFPKRILIIGAGVIGCEFATIFANFGETEVHLIDSQDRVIPFEDDDVSDYASKSLSNIGVNVYHEVTLRDIQKEDTHIDVILDYKKSYSKVIAVDIVLVSIGRVSALNKLKLNNLCLEKNKNGLLDVDSNCKVCDNVYAAGDISGHTSLMNIAEMEGRFAAKAIESKIIHPLKYNNISTIMFLNPEISSVGLNEKECKKQKIAYKVVTYSHALIPRAIAMRETNGFFKIIATDEEKPKILGMRAAGIQSAASVLYIASVIDQEKNIQEIMKTLHPHPSITEGIQECLRILIDKPILKPKAFPEYIKIKTWKPNLAICSENHRLLRR